MCNKREHIRVYNKISIFLFVLLMYCSLIGQEHISGLTVDRNRADGIGYTLVEVVLEQLDCVGCVALTDVDSILTGVEQLSCGVKFNKCLWCSGIVCVSCAHWTVLAPNPPGKRAFPIGQSTVLVADSALSGICRYNLAIARQEDKNTKQCQLELTLSHDTAFCHSSIAEVSWSDVVQSIGLTSDCKVQSCLFSKEICIVASWIDGSVENSVGGGCIFQCDGAVGIGNAHFSYTYIFPAPFFQLTQRTALHNNTIERIRT